MIYNYMTTVYEGTDRVKGERRKGREKGERGGRKERRGGRKEKRRR